LNGAKALEKRGSRKEAETETKQIIYEAVVRRFELETERTNDLDSKAANLTGLVGIILGVVTGFGSAYLTIPSDMKPDWHSLTLLSPVISFALVLLLLFITFVLALVGLQIRAFTYVPHSFNLIRDYENSEPQEVLPALYDEYAVAIKENRDVNDDKAKKIQKAMWSLFAALILLSVHALLFLVTKGR